MIKKPRIYRANGGWLCHGVRHVFYSETPDDAYAKWHMAEKYMDNIQGSTKMTVRNEEKKAFRDLTPEERGEIVEAWLNEKTEAWRGPIMGWVKESSVDQYLDDTVPYRIHQRQLVIPWGVIKPEYKWAAMDEDGGVYCFSRRPSFSPSQWLPESGSEVMRLDYLLTIDTTGINWRDSLTERPEGV